MQFWKVKSLIGFAAGILLFGIAGFPAQAAFTSLYIFGDGLSTTTNENSSSPLFYGQRFSNGRVWVEVLAQRQGLTSAATTNNDSYFAHYSSILVTEINNFSPPADVTNDLFIVWVCNADTFEAAQVPDNSNQWVAANNLSQTNHLQIITNLYAKGVRTLILPNAVDISEIPAWNTSSFTNVMHAGCIDYNTKFSNTISQVRALCPSLTIYTPDYYTLLNNVLTNAAYYGLTNMLGDGYSISAIYAQSYYPTLPPAATNGFGTNFIFWDLQDPTAKLHEIMADTAQQLISPSRITNLTVLNGSNRLGVASLPIGLNGFVDGTTNLAPVNWTSVTNFNSTNTTQTILVPASGPMQFYRLRFPFSWSWP